MVTLWLWSWVTQDWLHILNKLNHKLIVRVLVTTASVPFTSNGITITIAISNYKSGVCLQTAKFKNTLPAICQITLPLKISTDHSKADIGFFQCWSVIGSVSRDGHHLTVRVQATVNDSLHQRVLVCGRWAGQHSEIGPDFVNQILSYLCEQTNKKWRPS